MINYISIKQILDDLLDHPLLQDLTLERAINYAIRFIQIVGMPNEFEEKVETIHINNYRACLPCDFYEINQVRMSHKGHFRYFRGSNDSFHFSEEKNLHNQGEHDLTYKIQNSIIFTSVKDGDIEISYKAIKVDKEGYPVIPDNSSFITALELYIKKQVFTILYDMNKISANVLQNTQQEYAWYVGQAQSDLVRPSIDEMESITNMLNQMISRTNEHSKGFSQLGSREYIKQH